MYGSLSIPWRTDIECTIGRQSSCNVDIVGYWRNRLATWIDPVRTKWNFRRQQIADVTVATHAQLTMHTTDCRDWAPHQLMTTGDQTTSQCANWCHLRGFFAPPSHYQSFAAGRMHYKLYQPYAASLTSSAEQVRRHWVANYVCYQRMKQLECRKQVDELTTCRSITARDSVSCGRSSGDNDDQQSVASAYCRDLNDHGSSCHSCKYHLYLRIRHMVYCRHSPIRECIKGTILVLAEQSRVMRQTQNYHDTHSLITINK